MKQSIHGEVAPSLQRRRQQVLLELAAVEAQIAATQKRLAWLEARLAACKQSSQQAA